MRAAERLAPLGPLAREPWVVLAPLVVAQWIAVAVFTTFVNHNGWLFYQGGDQTWFYTSAWVIADGYIPETFVGWVWPLVLTPIAAVAGPSFLAGAPPIVLLQFFLLLPVGLFCAYAIAERIGGRLLGYWAAACWVFVPYAVIPLFVHRYHDTYVDQTLPQAFGLTGLADFPSMIVVLTSAFFVVRALETEMLEDALAGGLLAGLAIGLKPANGLFVFAPAVAFALARRWRGGTAFGLAIVPGLVVLALWKHRGSGIPLLADEPLRLAAAAETPDFSPPTFWERVRDYVPFDANQLNRHFLLFREYFWSARVLEYIPVAGVVATARRSVPIASLFAVWLAAFFLIKGSSPSVDVESGSLWRLLMPAWPAYFLLGVSLPLLVPRIGRRLATARPLHSWSRRSRRGLVVVAVAVFATPALAVMLLTPDVTQRTTNIEHRSLFLPIDQRFAARPLPSPPGFLRLTWPAATGHARPFYVVLRAPRRVFSPATSQFANEGQLCRPPVDGRAQRCALEMTELFRTRARVWTDRPPAGSWTYRIGVAANSFDDPEQGDILLVGAPLNVDVRG